MTDPLKPNIYFMYRHILHVECIAVIHVNLVTTATSDLFFPLGNINWLVFFFGVHVTVHREKFLQ